MPIEFTCGGCEKVLRVPDMHAGKQARCPVCQTLNLIQENVAPEAKVEGSPFASLPSDEIIDSPPGSPFGSPQSGAPQRVPVSGNPYSAGMTPVAGSPRQYVPHRGGIVLALGIISLMCNPVLVPGIIAWVLGRNDLRSMDAGVMDSEGRGITQAGMITGIIGTLLHGAFYLFYGAMIVLLIIAAAAQ